jgi:hypothetical protein
MALVALMIRWGGETSSERLRQCARCTECGHRDASLQHAGWGAADLGSLPFPMEKQVQPTCGAACRITSADPNAGGFGQ